MMEVGLDGNSARSYIKPLAETSASVKVCIACFKAPANVTLSGSEAQLEHLEGILRSKSIFARILDVQVAYHSPDDVCVLGSRRCTRGAWYRRQPCDQDLLLLFPAWETYRDPTIAGPQTSAALIRRLARSLGMPEGDIEPS